MCIRDSSETAVKAVSELEKKADKIINNKILVKKTNSSGIKFLHLKIGLKH